MLQRGPGLEEGGVNAIRTTLRRIRDATRGATAIEYGLIVALLSIACIAAMQNIGGGMGRIYNNVQNAM